MTYADALVLAVAIGAIAFMCVNHARLVAPMLKAAAQFHEAAANFSLMQDRHVEARIAMLNTKVPKQTEPFEPQRDVPDTGEPPLPGEMPNFVDPFSATEREAAKHPRRNERDLLDDVPQDGVAVQR